MRILATLNLSAGTGTWHPGSHIGQSSRPAHRNKSRSASELRGPRVGCARLTKQAYHQIKDKQDGFKSGRGQQLNDEFSDKCSYERLHGYVVATISA